MDLTLDHEFTLNPDGSGKVRLKWEGPAEADSPHAIVRGELGGAQGVEQWGPMSCEIVDGRAKFGAVAYFRNLAGLKFHCQGFHATMMDFQAKRTGKDFAVSSRWDAPEVPKSVTKIPKKELKAAIDAERAKIAQARGFIEGMFGGLKVSSTIHLPGAVGKATNAKKAGPRAVSVAHAGEDLLEVIDRLMEDDALAARLVQSGGAGPQTLSALLGEHGPMEVTTKGKLEDQFDFEAEVAQAREEFEEQRRKMGVPAPSSRGPEMGNCRVVAVKIVREADPDRELHPMGQNCMGMTLTIAGDLPGRALGADGGRVEKILAEGGDDLTPDDDWKRRIHFPKLTKDGATTYFDVEVPLTERGLAELSGAIKCQVASGDAEEIDLGFAKVESGAEGKQFGARIEKLEEWGEDQQSLDLKLAVPIERVAGMSLKSKAGVQELERSGYSSGGGECQVSFTVKGGVPPGAKLVARLYGDVSEVEVPFRIKGVGMQP